MSNKLLTLVFNCSRFRGTDRLVLLAIADRINEETWTCVCTYEDLMRRCHCARSVLAEALVELHKSGVLVKRRRFSAATVYSLDERLLREWHYPKPNGSESKLPRSFGNRTNTDSGEREYGSPNANPVEPNSPPSGADRGAGTESLRCGLAVKRSETGGSPPTIANANDGGSASQREDNPNTQPPDDQRVNGGGLASPSTPALPRDHRGRTPVPPGAFPDRDAEPARYLANELWMFLSGRPEVEIPFDWERLWTKDFESALRSYSYDDVWLAIRASQTGVARPMYVRAWSIVNQLDRLIDNGQKLEKGGFLEVRSCPYCHAALTDLHHVGHVLNCPDGPEINPADAAEERLADIHSDLISEGIAQAADGPLFNPFGDGDKDNEDGVDEES